MERLKEQWEAIKERVRVNYDISDLAYATWFANLRLVDVRNGEISIELPDEQDVFIELIEVKFGGFFKEEIKQELGYDVKLHFVKSYEPVTKTDQDLLLEGAERILVEKRGELNRAAVPLKEVDYELRVFEHFVNRIQGADEERTWEELQLYNAYRIKRVEEAIKFHKSLVGDVSVKGDESDYAYISRQLRMGNLQENERVLRLLTDIASLLCEYEVLYSKRLINRYLNRNL